VNNLLNARSVRRLDVGVAVWVLIWFVIGVLLWHDIGTQVKLSDNIVKTGTAVESVGRAFSLMGRLPLVGGGLDGVSEGVEKAGAQVAEAGVDSRNGIKRAAITSGLGAGLMPPLLILALYLPIRLRWQRHVRAVAAALPDAVGDPAFEQYLARCALAALPWDELRALVIDPCGAVERGDCAALAAAELQRLGLREL